MLKLNTCALEIIGDNTYEINIEPLEQGMGHTIGYALKQVMYGCLPGYKVTKLTISINNMLITPLDTKLNSDVNVMELMLNLSDLHFLPREDTQVEHFTVEISCSQGKKLTAQDIAGDQLLVSEPHQLILSYDGLDVLTLKVQIEKNTGFIAAIPQQDGVFTTDTYFSPVIACDYQVLDARVGGTINYNQLKFQFKTNQLYSGETLIQSALDIMNSVLAVNETNQQLPQ